MDDYPLFNMVGVHLIILSNGSEVEVDIKKVWHNAEGIPICIESVDGGVYPWVNLLAIEKEDDE